MQRQRPLFPVLLALSLVANAALLGVCLTRESGKHEDTSRAAKPASGAELAKAGGAVDVSGLAPEVVARIGAGDEATLRDLLLACGMEPKAVRHLVESAVERRFETEKVAMMMRKRGKGWWKRNPDWWSYPGSKEIIARQNAEIEQLVGTLPGADEYPWETERWDFLPAEKREALRKLDRDYKELRDNLPPLPWLPREHAMSEALHEEKRHDLEATLSREELAEYDFRAEADYFAQNLDKYEITDAELRVLWRADRERQAKVKALMEALAARYGTRDPFAGHGSAWSPEAREAESQANEAARRLDEAYEKRMKEVIGATRMARGDLKTNEVFEGIARVTDKFGLGREQAEAIYEVVEHAHKIIETDAPDAAEIVKLRDAAWAEIGEQVPPEALMLIKQSLGFRHHQLKSE